MTGRWRYMLGAMLVACAGCASSPEAPPPAKATAGPAMSMPPLFDTPQDPVPAVPLVMFLDVYRVTVPAGTISTSEAFWKHIDEHAVDVSSYDLLFRNGVRVGTAPSREWEYFRSILDQYPTNSQKITFSNVDRRPVEIIMNPQVRSQDVFYLDHANDLHGRSYDESQNLLSMSYLADPRRPDNVRLRVCPVVRAKREKLEFTATNQEKQLQYVVPERCYELGLEATVPLDDFLVIAPSAEAKWSTSIGARFLTKDDPAERLEYVLIVVPRLYRVPAMPATAAAAGTRGKR